jgi:protein tyrosine phosphatase domain-containing protein 1
VFVSSLGIKSIINLQKPGEHASCGNPLEGSGFTYDPNIFMENNSTYAHYFPTSKVMSINIK